MTISYILEKSAELAALQNELVDTLSKLRLIQCHVQDIPQFGRGASLPAIIQPETIKKPFINALRQCIEPQRIFDYTHNTPKRFAGLIQLESDRKQFDTVDQLKLGIDETRRLIVQSVLEEEPTSRKRATLTKKLFPDVLYQTLTRTIPVAPYNTQKVSLTWCTSQKCAKRITDEEALAMVEGFNASAPSWQAERNLAKLGEVPSVYKASQVRPHPQAQISHSMPGQKQLTQEMKKVFSPIIVLTQSEQKVAFHPLTEHQSEKPEKALLSGYKRLIEGTCLIYKESDLVSSSNVG